MAWVGSAARAECVAIDVLNRAMGQKLRTTPPAQIALDPGGAIFIATERPRLDQPVAHNLLLEKGPTSGESSASCNGPASPKLAERFSKTGHAGLVVRTSKWGSMEGGVIEEVSRVPTMRPIVENHDRESYTPPSVRDEKMPGTVGCGQMGWPFTAGCLGLGAQSLLMAYAYVWAIRQPVFPRLSRFCRFLLPT
jgi:hypothetical protein